MTAFRGCRGKNAKEKFEEEPHFQTGNWLGWAGRANA
jgi:hypothetical protein